MLMLKDEVHEGEETPNEDVVMTEDAKGFTLLFATAADHEWSSKLVGGQTMWCFFQIISLQLFW